MINYLIKIYYILYFYARKMLHEINLIKSFSILTVLKSFQKHTSAKMRLTKKLTSSEKSSNINLMRNEFVKYTIPTFTQSQVATFIRNARWISKENYNTYVKLISEVGKLSIITRKNVRYRYLSLRCIKYSKMRFIINI